MFSPKKHKLLKKFFAVSFFVIFLFVVNFGILSQARAQTATSAGAGAVAGASLCTLSATLSTTAAMGAGGVGWLNPSLGASLSACSNSILVALWKYAVFPLIKKMAYNLVLQGDFGLTWEGLKDWFWYDLVFQTAEQVLNKIGLSLCTKLSATIRLVLYQSVSPDYAPQCTFQQSELAQIIDDAFRNGGDAAWARLRRDFFGMFYFTTQPPYNQFGEYWMAKAQIAKNVAQVRTGVQTEIAFSNGFFGSRDCEDKNKDGKVQKPQECTIVTPGRWIADRVFGEQTQKENATLQTQVLADLGALTAELIDIIVNQQISGLFNDLNDYFRNEREDAERDYIKSLQTEQSKNQSPISGNQSIDFPAQKTGYSVTP